MSIGLPRGYKPGNDASNGVILPLRVELNGDYKIYASGNIAVLGEMTGANGEIHNWDYTGYEIQQFCIGGSFPGVKSIDGCLQFFENHSTYGTGFQADVQVEFDKFLDRIEAVACFGKAPSELKYFFVDATVSLQKSIPLGAISLNGFCGGVSNRMSSTFNSSSLSFTDDFDPAILEVGTSVSGIQYQPDASAGLGLRAGATFVLTSLPSLTNGSILMKMDFAAAGGLQEFSMKGTAKFLEVPEQLAGQLLPFAATAGRPESNAYMVANVDLKVNGSGIFGKFECFLDAGMMKGRGTDGKLVDAVVKFTAGEWYIWIGQPEPKSLRAGLIMDLGGLNKLVDSYFCMGSKIPNFPDIPYDIRKHIPAFASASSLRGGGGGLVFGASFKISAHVNALVASGDVEAKGGFDIMLRNYSDMNCDGEAIGLNGWYGAGQAWAMLSGRLKVFGVNVFSATIAAAFQARLPNPTFLEASVSLEACAIYCFDVDMHITIGEECNFQSNDPNNVLGTEVIANVIPFTNSQDLALDSKPQVFFNVPVKDGAKIQDLSGNEKTFNVRVKRLDLNSISQDIALPFDASFNESKNYVIIDPKYLLPHNDSIELIIEVEVLEGSNVIHTEEKRVVFHTTPTLPTFANNIKTSYPLEGMSNFYKDEVGEEFIVLKQILYDYIEGSDADLKVKLCSKESNSCEDVPFSVVDYGKKLIFDISPLLTTEKFYELKIFELQSSQEGATQTERELLSIPFRTSMFASFSDKIASFHPSALLGNFDFTHEIEFTEEGFDDIEINNRLVRAVLYSEDYQKLLHQEYQDYTNYTDEFIQQYCSGIDKLPGCFSCVPASVLLTKDIARYNAKWKTDYKKNVIGFLTPYFEEIRAGLGQLPPGEIYNFYSSYSNVRGNSTVKVRAEADPNMALMYFTPEGTKVSFQEVR